MKQRRTKSVAALPWPTVELLDALPDAVVVVESGTIVYANDRIEELTGWSADELVGESVEVLVPKPLRSVHVQRREEYRRNPEVRPMGTGLDITLRRRSGTEIPIDISLAPVRHDQGVFTVAVVRDATLRRAMERRLRRELSDEQERIQQLRRADDDKNAFLRAVAHDLKTPFAVISGIAQTLLAHSDKLDPEQIRHMITRLDSQAQQGTRLINDLLDVDRLDAEGERLDLERVQLDEVVRHAAERATNEDEVDFDLEEFRTVVDPVLVGRIVENLVRNALSHAAGEEPPMVTLRVEDDDLLLSVDDRGPGVSDEDKEAIFMPYRSGRGRHGIGLSLVSRFAEMQGGRAWVEDRPGGGASFRVRLPIRRRKDGSGY